MMVNNIYQYMFRKSNELTLRSLNNASTYMPFDWLLRKSNTLTSRSFIPWTTYMCFQLFRKLNTLTLRSLSYHQLFRKSNVLTSRSLHCQYMSSPVSQVKHATFAHISLCIVIICRFILLQNVHVAIYAMVDIPFWRNIYLKKLDGMKV